MKKTVSFPFVFIFLISLATAQPASKLSYELAKMAGEGAVDRSISLFIKGNMETIESLVRTCGGTFKYAAGDIAAVRIPVMALELFYNSPGVVRMEGSAPKLQLMNDQMLINNNIWPVRLGQGPLNGVSYTGANVVMGIIDTGIDFTHPDFKQANGNTRIRFLWDHLLPDTINTPQPYNYGQEFTDSDIDNGMAAAHHDQGGHGTHVAGIATGNGNAMNNYSGVAPEADIIAVSLNFNQPDNSWLGSVADAVKYIYDKAAGLGKPCVINISAGTYMGSHDGKDLQAQLIDNLITQQNGRSLVCAAGNAGTFPIHLKYTVANDSAFTWFYKPAGSTYIEMWGDTATFKNISFAIGADQKTPNYEFRGRLPYTTIASHLNLLQKDTLFNAGNRIGIIESYGQLVGGTYSMAFNITPDSAYNWRLITNGNGTFDVWSFDMVFTNLPNSAVFPDITRYKAPDLHQTIVSSFTCSDKVITVGEYINRDHYTDANGTIQTFPFTVGTHTPGSSQGPTRDGRIKPDISATGLVTLSCAVLADVPWFLANAPDKLAAGAKHIRDGGTSSASPVVAGIAALYLEKNPAATYLDIKNAILGCAKTDTYTGSNLPNNIWGYGKADAFAALTGCSTGLDEPLFSGDVNLYCYPNPASGEALITFNFSDPHSGKMVEINLRDVAGRLVAIIPLTEDKHSAIFRKSDLPGGMYFYTLLIDGVQKATRKLVIQ